MKSFLKNVVQRKEGQGGVLIGKTVKVGPYTVRVESHIADGGFACIYKVRDISNGQAYAMKHMRLMGDAEAIADCMTEVNTLKKLRGVPSVITVRAVAFSGARGSEQEAYLILDLCKENLVEFIQAQGNKLSSSTVIHIFCAVCQAVAAMHQQTPPLAHRDLKAENVLQHMSGEWVLCDFGSATDKMAVYESSNAVMMGEEVIRKYTTPAYRAPEMWDLYSRDRIDTKADIWALGCLLYFLMFGKLAFQAEAKLQILNGEISVPPTRPPPLVALLRELLEVSPSRRPDILTVLRRLQEVADAMNVDPALLVPRTPPSSLPAREEAQAPPTRQTSVASLPSPPPPPPLHPSHPAQSAPLPATLKAPPRSLPQESPPQPSASVSPSTSQPLPLPAKDVASYRRSSSMSKTSSQRSMGSGQAEAGGGVSSPPEQQQGFADFASLEELTPRPGGLPQGDHNPSKQTASPPRSQRRLQPRQSSAHSLASDTPPSAGGELAATRKLLAEAQAQVQQLQTTVKGQQATIKQLQVDNFNHVSQLKRLGLDPTPSVVTLPPQPPPASTAEPGWASFGSPTSFDPAPPSSAALLPPLKTESGSFGGDWGETLRGSPTKHRFSSSLPRSPQSRTTSGGFDAFGIQPGFEAFPPPGPTSNSGVDSPSETMSRHSALSAFAESLKQPALMGTGVDEGSPLSQEGKSPLPLPQKPPKKSHRRSTSEPVAIEHMALVEEH